MRQAQGGLGVDQVHAGGSIPHDWPGNVLVFPNQRAGGSGSLGLMIEVQNLIRGIVEFFDSPHFQ